jgi:hypothetical protein
MATLAHPPFGWCWAGLRLTNNMLIIAIMYFDNFAGSGMRSKDPDGLILDFSPNKYICMNNELIIENIYR